MHVTLVRHANRLTITQRSRYAVSFEAGGTARETSVQSMSRIRTPSPPCAAIRRNSPDHAGQYYRTSRTAVVMMMMMIHVVSLSQTSTRQQWKRGCIASCCTRSFRPAYQHNPDSARIRLFQHRRETTTHLPSVDVLHDLLLPGNSGLLSSEGVSVLLGEQQRDEVDARPGLFAVQLSVRQPCPAAQTPVRSFAHICRASKESDCHI